MPQVALITLRFESVSDRSPRLLIECPRKGIARMNGWKMNSDGPKEISFHTHQVDDKNSSVHFVKVVASKRICQLIQAQEGQLWISGGQATARWKGKELTHDNDVQYGVQ